MLTRVVTGNSHHRLPEEGIAYGFFSSGLEAPAGVPVLLVGVGAVISLSSGAGGGVEYIVYPIQAVMPRIPRTATTTGTPTSQGLQDSLVSPKR